MQLYNLEAPGSAAEADSDYRYMPKMYSTVLFQVWLDPKDNT